MAETGNKQKGDRLSGIRTDWVSMTEPLGVDVVNAPTFVLALPSAWNSPFPALLLLHGHSEIPSLTPLY